MNKEFVAAFQAANNGRNPDLFSIGGYDGMHLIYEALKKTNGDASGDALVGAAKGMAWQSPRGPMSIDPETRDVVQTVYIREVKKVGDKLPERHHRRDPGRKGSAARRREVRHSPAGLAQVRRDRPARHRAVRRLRLRDAPVRPVCGAVRHAGVDEFRQPRARRVRHARRLHCRDSHAPARRSVPCRPAGRFPGCGVVSILFERTLFRRLYRAGELNQVLFTIGLVFVAAATAAYIFGTGTAANPDARLSARRGRIRRNAVRRIPPLPHRRGAADHGFARISAWSARVSAPGSAPRSTISASRKGSDSMSTASSPSPSRSAAALPGSAGRWQSRSSASTRHSAFIILVYVLIVVSVGGLGSITGSFVGAALLGIGDVAGKYFVPEIGVIPDLSAPCGDPVRAPARPLWKAVSPEMADVGQTEIGPHDWLKRQSRVVRSSRSAFWAGRASCRLSSFRPI